MNSKELMLELFSSFICRRKPNCEKISDEGFLLLKECAEKQKILPACVDSLLKYNLIDSESKYFDYSKQVLIDSIRFYYDKLSNLLNIYTKLIDCGITPVLVKGFICNNEYPVTEYRISSDEDILVKKEDFEKCKIIFLNNGYCLETNSRSHELQFYNKDNGMKIEVHSSLFSDNDIVYSKFNDFINTEDVKEIYLEGVKVFTLSDTAHLMYLILHSYRHFIKYGLGIRQIADIAVFLKKDDINRNFIFEASVKLSVENYLNVILLICNKYFGLKLDYIKQYYKNFDNEFDYEIDITDFVNELISYTVYGDMSVVNRHFSIINSDKYGSLSGDNYSKIQMIFPSVDVIKHHYKYLKKYSFLLPVAWIQRAFVFFYDCIFNYKDIKKLKNKNRLLKKYKIIS